MNGEGKKSDLDLLLQIAGQMGNGMTICVFADAAIAPVLSGITKFREEFEAYIAKSTKPEFELPASADITAAVADRTAAGIHSLMAKVTVDGKVVEVPNDANALEACRAAGVEVPHFCYHPRLSIVGQCRMCMVEVEGVPKIQASCTVPVRDGMVIKASTEKALAARNATMEFLLINHPLDCPICDQAGECKLQDNAVRRRPAGLAHVRAAPAVSRLRPHADRPARHRRHDALHPVHALHPVLRGDHRRRASSRSSSAAGTRSSGRTRARRSTTTSPRARPTSAPWARSRRRTSGSASASGGSTRPARSATAARSAATSRSSTGTASSTGILPRVAPAVNDFWMCDYGRFRAEELNRQDFLKPEIRVAGGDARKQTNWGEALDAVKVAIDRARGEEKKERILLRREEKKISCSSGRPSSRPRKPGFLRRSAKIL